MNQSIAPTRPLCILYSGDIALRERLAHVVRDRAYLCHAPDANRLDELLSAGEAMALFIDLRSAGALEFAPRLSRAHPEAVGVALGYPDSEPFISAHDAGLYRVEDLELGNREFGNLVDQVLERVGWIQENQMLRNELTRLQMLQQHGGGPRGGGPRHTISFQHLVKATRHLDRLDDLFEKIVEGVANSALVSRVGLFYRPQGEHSYRLQAGCCCLDDTASLRLSDRDPLVRWLQRNPRLVTRASLAHIVDPSERTLLRRALDLFGAETFIPLNLRGRVLGWLFTGQTDGLPFDHHDHPELSFLSEHIVNALENAIRHDELLLQKNLGEHVLQMMPTAVVTVDAEGSVTWSNSPAERLFPALARASVASSPGKPPARLPLQDLGSRLAGMVHDALAGEPTREARVWESQAAGGRTLSVRTRQLMGGGKCQGAVALIDDLTDQIRADAQQAHLERGDFWRDLAAGLSHEIRNPLVAIKTFTQLLPARHADPEFRHDFTTAVAREVARLDAIVAHIEGFAHPPITFMAAFDIEKLLETAIKSAMEVAVAPDAQIKVQADDDLPTLHGDGRALTQVMQHLFVNAIEAAMFKKVRAQIRVRAITHRVGNEVVGVKLAIVDNGPGMPAELRSKAFSPFCTSKAQGLGLGLAVAQRVVLDHGGSIELDSGTLGMCVNISLPIQPPAITPPAVKENVAAPAPTPAQVVRHAFDAEVWTPEPDRHIGSLA